MGGGRGTASPSPVPGVTPPGSVRGATVTPPGSVRGVTPPAPQPAPPPPTNTWAAKIAGTASQDSSARQSPENVKPAVAPQASKPSPAPEPSKSSPAPEIAPTPTLDEPDKSVPTLKTCWGSKPVVTPDGQEAKQASPAPGSKQTTPVPEEKKAPSELKEKSDTASQEPAPAEVMDSSEEVKDSASPAGPPTVDREDEIVTSVPESDPIPTDPIPSLEQNPTGNDNPSETTDTVNSPPVLQTKTEVPDTETNPPPSAPISDAPTSPLILPESKLSASAPEFSLSASAPEFKPPAMLSASAPEFKPPPALLAALPVLDTKLSATAPDFTPSFRLPVQAVVEEKKTEVVVEKTELVVEKDTEEVVPIEKECEAKATDEKETEPVEIEVKEIEEAVVDSVAEKEVEEPLSAVVEEVVNNEPESLPDVVEVETVISEETRDSTPVESSSTIEPVVIPHMEEIKPVAADVSNGVELETKQPVEGKVQEETNHNEETNSCETGKIDSTDNVIEKVNQTVISDVVIADTNGNFQTDDNENITPIKSLEVPVKEEAVLSVSEEVVEHKMTNGEATEEEIDTENPAEINDNVVVPNGVADKLPYRDDQWSPANTDGKKQYDRDFLLQLQKNPLSLQKPQQMPDMEIILPEADLLRNVASAPNKFDMTPQYIKSSTSHSRGTPNRRDSRRKESSSAAARLATGTGGTPVKVITLQREEVNLKQAENAWKPGVAKKKVGSDAESKEDDLDDLSKKIRAILNKLCPQKFDILVNQFKELVMDTKDLMTRGMELVFEKALDEPIFSVAYARMCREMSMKKAVDEDGRDVNFRALLIARCQKEFMTDYMDGLDQEQYKSNIAKATTDDEKKLISAQFAATELKLRKRSLGNIRFIGELYKIGMLTGRIMHECIKKLLKTTDEESLECLCRLVTTVGEQLDKETITTLATRGTASGFVSLDDYFANMKEITGDKKISARVRFLMQDVIELRKLKWVKRREEAGPKTIEQIHEQAQKEALQVKLKDMGPGPPPARRSEDRSDRRRSTPRGPPKDRQAPVTGDGWSNIPERAAKMSVGKVDTSKLKINKVDVNQIQLGPPGGMRPGGFTSWGKGAAMNKKNSVQEAPLKQGNRFAMLLDDDEPSNSMPPPSSTYHGRASEPAYRPGAGYGGGRADSRERSGGRYAGRSSGDPKSGRNSREGSYTEGSNSRGGSRDGSKVAPRQQVISEGVAGGLLKGKGDSDQDVLETKTKAILDEFLNNQDMGEAFLCISELYHENTIGNIVEIVFNNVVERTSKDRTNSGNLFSYLLKNESLPYPKFLAGARTVLEFAEDLQIDIPKFWTYLAEMFGLLVLTKVVQPVFLVDAVSELDNSLHGKFVAAMLIDMARQDVAVTVALWRQSGLSLAANFNVASVEQFVTDNKLEFLDQPLSNGVTSEEQPQPPKPEVTLASKLSSLLMEEGQMAQLVDLIRDQVEDPTATTFIRLLVNQVLEACIDTKDSAVSLNVSRLKSLGVPVLKRYLDAEKDLDAAKEREVAALYSMQALVNRLEHPNKLLHSIFDALYDCDVISEDAFLEWEVSDLPGEQEGKGVALKSCTQFIQWLKTAEPEDDPEQSTKVNFELGEECEATEKQLVVEGQ